MCLSLLDIVVWVKTHIDSNPIKNDWNELLNNEINTTLIQQKGIVEKDENRHYHCGDIILTYKHINDKGYNIGDEIKIIRFANNTNEKTMHFYQKIAILTERV